MLPLPSHTHHGKLLQDQGPACSQVSQRRAQAPILTDSIAPAGADILLKSVSLGLTLAIEDDYLSFMVGSDLPEGQGRLQDLPDGAWQGHDEGAHRV
jgi:hypothetical protein